MAKVYHACPTLRLLHIMGMKWSVPILELLASSRDSIHFNLMHMTLRSITSRELSKSLSELRAAGMVAREEADEGSVRNTTYSLTYRGKMLRNLIYDAKKLGVSFYGVERSCPSRQCRDCIMFNGFRTDHAN